MENQKRQNLLPLKTGCPWEDDQPFYVILSDKDQILSAIMKILSKYLYWIEDLEIRERC